MALYQPPTRNGLQKTLDSQLDEGFTTSMTLNNVTGVQVPGIVVINRIDTNNAQKAAALREYVSFTGISGNTLTGLTRALAGSTDQDHAVGSVVEFVFDVVQMQAVYDALRETVDADGTLDATKVVDPTTAQTLTNKTINYDDNTIQNLPIYTDGWTPAGETWTYASATTFTVAGVDVTAKYQKGTRIKLTQTTAKYFVVTGSSFSTDTTVTITGGTDYTLANAAISDNYYSYQASPQGYPTWFNWTPTITYAGGTTDPTSNAINLAMFCVTGAKIDFLIKSTLTKGTGNRTIILYSLPTDRNTTDVLAYNAYSSCSGSNAMPVCIDEGTDKAEIFETMSSNGNYAISGSYDL